MLGRYPGGAHAAGRLPCRSSRLGPRSLAPCRSPGERFKPLCRPVRVHPPEVEDFEEIAVELEDEDQTPFDEIVNRNNTDPDFTDEDWASKVTDWGEFWYTIEWGDDELDVDDEHDASLTSEARVERAKQMIQALSDLDKRNDVIKMLGSPTIAGLYHDEPDEQILEYEVDVRNPAWTAFDFRAMVEKRRKKELVDKEWRRQQALASRFHGLTYYTDVRVRREEDDWIREEWTHEQILDMIVGGGAYVEPEKVQVDILNPYAVADYHNQYGVRHIPETEEAIAAMGHLADESVLLQLDQGVELGSGDFVDPTLMFGDEEGTIYMEAPVNEWQQEQRLQTGMVTDQLVEMLELDGEGPYAADEEAMVRDEADAHNYPVDLYPDVYDSEDEEEPGGDDDEADGLEEGQ